MPSRLVAWLSRHRVTLLRAGTWLLVCELAYVVAATLFLNSARFAAIVNREPDRYFARWEWAASAYPGHVYARRVVMGGHARLNRWTVAADSAHGRIRVLPLLRKEVRFGRIRAHEVSFDVRRVAEDMPSRRRDETRPWTLSFAAITTPTLRRLDYYAVRVEGTGEASFSLVKRLRGGTLEVEPSTLHMPDARLSVDGLPLLVDGRLDFSVSLPAHIRAQAQGIEKLALVDATMKIAGRAPGLDLQSREGAGALPIEARAGAGHVSADLVMERGALMPGSRLDWAAPVTALGKDGTLRRHRLDVALRVAREGLFLAARIPRQPSLPDVLHADLQVAERRIDPDDWLAPVRASSGRVVLGWRFGSLAWADALLGTREWLRLEGAADVRADVRLRDGRIVEGSTFAMDDARLQADVLDNRFTGAARARGRVERDGNVQRTRIDIVADRFRLAPRESPEATYVRGRDLRLDLRSTGDLARFHEELDARLRFDDAEIPDLRAYNRYLPQRSLSLLGGTGRASGDLSLDRGGDVVHGRLQVHGTGARVAFGVSRLSGDLQLDSRLRRAERTGRAYSLEGFSLGLDNVRLEGDDAGPWWARFALDDGQLAWQEPFEVSGRGRLKMKDVSVLLALFAERSAFPKWAGRIVDAGQAEATGRLRIRGDEVVLDGIEARNDRVDLLARLRIAAGQPSGDLYARWGILGLGVGLEGGQRKLHLAGAREWYDARPALLPAEAARKDRSR